MLVEVPLGGGKAPNLCLSSSRPCLLGTDGGKHNRNLFRRSPVALSARLSDRPPSCEIRIENWDHNHTNGRVGLRRAYLTATKSMQVDVSVVGVKNELLFEPLI